MPPKQQAPVQQRFACQSEAALLLNCIAADEYIEQKCVQYMKRLRKCTQQERIVNFDISPCETTPEPSQKTEEAPKKEDSQV